MPICSVRGNKVYRKPTWSTASNHLDLLGDPDSQSIKPLDLGRKRRCV